MKIAITATGKEIDSQMDPRFGRAQYILIVDEDGAVLEAIDNSQNLNADEGSGNPGSEDPGRQEGRCPYDRALWPKRIHHAQGCRHQRLRPSNPER